MAEKNEFKTTNWADDEDFDSDEADDAFGLEAAEKEAKLLKKANAEVSNSPC